MTYWIGGSPCAGKSSVAALLAGTYGLRYVQCDAGTGARMARMAGSGLPAYDELTGLSTCERLARPPEQQCAREVAFYTEQFPFLLAELPARADLLVEGADLLPALLAGHGVPDERSIWLVPTPEFQVRHYARRPWVGAYLADCPDPAAAFGSWMQRDIRFAAHVRSTAAAIGGRVIVVDGTGTVAATAAEVARHFGLRPR